MSWLQHISNYMVGILLVKYNFFCICRLLFQAEILNCGVPQGCVLARMLFLTYIDNLPQSLSNNGSYFHVGDTCIFYQDKGICEIEHLLT